jgi:hypothetical protein
MAVIGAAKCGKKYNAFAVFSPLFIKVPGRLFRCRLSRRGGLIFFKEDFFMSNKKFYLVGMAVLLSVSLFLIGCPTEAENGTNGIRGDNVGIIAVAGSVDDEDLAAAFLAADVVTLGPKVTDVFGKVPSGQRLVVSGTLPVTIGEELVVEGSVEVAKGAALAGIGDVASGSIKSAAGSVYGQGTLALPYTAADGYLSYSNVSFAGTKAIGGLSAGNLATFFADPDNSAVTALTVYNLPAISAADVPADKTVTLAGTGNTVTTALDLTGKGTLVVAEGAVLAASTAITITGAEVGTPAKPNFVVNGTIAPAVAGAVALTFAGKVDLSKAVIDLSTVTGGFTLTAPAAALAVKEIKIGQDDLTIAAATALTVEKVTPGTVGKGVKSASVTAYTTSEGNSISPTTGQLATVVISKIDNNEVTVETGTAAAQIDNIAGSAIKVKINGANGVNIPGVGDGKLLLTTANLAKFMEGTGNKITVTGIATGTAETLVIPEDLEVVAASATLAAVTGLTVKGKLTADAATLAKAATITIEDGAEFTSTSAAISLPATGTAITVGEGARLTAAGGTNTWANLKTLSVGNNGSTVDLSGVAATLADATSITVGTGSELKVGAALTLAGISAAATGITGEGTITAGAVTAAAAVTKLIGSGVDSVSLAVTTYAGALTIPEGKTRTFTGVTFAPDNTVGVNGTLRLQGNTTLVNNALIGSNGVLVLVTGKAITLGDDNAAITGTSYAITPESDETTGTLTAGVENTAVVFTASSIEGYGNSEVSLAGLTTPEATSAATLTFGTADSELTISDATTVAGVILDVSAKGKIIVAEGKVLTLALGEGDNHVGSGGIFTKVGGNSTVNVVKANGVMDTTALSPDTAAGLASAKIAAAGAADSVKAETAAAGTITGVVSDTTIDVEDTFAVTTSTITVTHS